MLKIYFDWNCITHSKDKYPYILNLAEECGDRILFPFSNAHIRDVLVSRKKGNKYFDSDLLILERICGKHYLLFEDDQIHPKFATPSEVVNVSGDALELIQKFEFISPEIYALIKDEIRKHLPPSIYKKIQGAAPKDVISTIDHYISLDLPSQNLESFLSLYQPKLGHLISVESRFKSMCMALDIFGFRPEKRDKQLMNIDADASHIFYAGHCDIFVTADSKLRGKAEALYSKYNFQTRIIHPDEFEAFVNDELQKEYSLINISKVIDEYGTPRIENDGAHYKLLPYHIFGTFNVCHKIDKYWGYKGDTKAGLFRYCFNNTPYLFYTEITHFCNFIESLLPQSEKDVFHEGFVKPLVSGDYKTTSKAKYSLICEDLDMKIEILSDPESPIPAPMMLFIHGDKFDNLYNRIGHLNDDHPTY